MEETDTSVTRPQAWLGLFSLVLSFSSFFLLYLIADGIRQTTSALENIPLVPLASSVMLIGRFMGSWWLLIAALILSFQIFWVRKRFGRVLVFNAVYSTVLLIVLVVWTQTYFAQKMVAIESLRKSQQ